MFFITTGNTFKKHNYGGLFHLKLLSTTGKLSKIII